jgi:DNA polymerase-4
MILHIDMDAFYASVEIRDNPKLKGLPVVVGGSPKGRGVISAANYEARKFGVYSAMPSSIAIRKCPNLIFVKTRMDYYAKISKQIREIFFRFTSLVEPLALDEAFLDVSGSEKLFGDGPTIARKIKDTIRDELNLTASAGVAPNKFLAKLASDLEKPDGLVIVDPNNIEEFLDPLEIERVWGVGKQTLKKFQRLNVRNIRQLRQLDLDSMKRLFGLNAEHFWRLARGLDTRPVVPDRIAKSVSHETTFSHDLTDRESLRAWLMELVQQVGRRLRRHEIRGRTVKIKVRFSDFRTITRSVSLAEASASTGDLEAAVDQLFQKVDIDDGGVRLVGMGVSNLSSADVQQQLLFESEERSRNHRLDEMKDQLKDRFGHDIIRRGTSIEHGIQRRPDPRVNDSEN